MNRAFHFEGWMAAAAALLAGAVFFRFCVRGYSYIAHMLTFIAALLASVMLHEAGHLLTAKRFGMKATQYFVGFGPTLWSRTRGETEYGLKAIPAGGFCDIAGMTALDEVTPEEAKELAKSL